MVFLYHFGHKYIFNQVRNRYIGIIRLLIKTTVVVKRQTQASGPGADPQALLTLSPSYGFGCPEARPWPRPARTECSCVTEGPPPAGSLGGVPPCLPSPGAGCSSALCLVASNSPSPMGLFGVLKRPPFIFNQCSSVCFKWDSSHAYI